MCICNAASYRRATSQSISHIGLEGNIELGSSVLRLRKAIIDRALQDAYMEDIK